MTITLYDCATAPSPRRARIVRVKPGEQHANLIRWRAIMSERPAFKV